MSALCQKRTSPDGGLGRDPLRLVFGGSLDTACSNPPQTVHVAFMSLKPLFFYGKGRHGESYGEEKEGQEENQDLKLEARASYWRGTFRFRGVIDLAKRLNGVRPLSFFTSSSCFRAAQP
jgi:hypothetical protein